MTKECTQKVFTLLVKNKHVGWICTLLYYPKNYARIHFRISIGPINPIVHTGIFEGQFFNILFYNLGHANSNLTVLIMCNWDVARISRFEQLILCTSKFNINRRLL